MGFFKMFKKPKTSVTLKLPKDTFSLGSNIDTTIIVSAKEEFDATDERDEIVTFIRESRRGIIKRFSKNHVDEDIAD